MGGDGGGVLISGLFGFGVGRGAVSLLAESVFKYDESMLVSFTGFLLGSCVGVRVGVTNFDSVANPTS